MFSMMEIQQDGLKDRRYEREEEREKKCRKRHGVLSKRGGWLITFSTSLLMVN